jgi:hypothetical protein
MLDGSSVDATTWLKVGIVEGIDCSADDGDSNGINDG